MDGIYQTVMGDRGRLVIPAGLRSQVGLTEGTPLILLDTPGGVVLLRREQLKARVRAELEGLDLVGDLLRERRQQARDEDTP